MLEPLGTALALLLDVEDHRRRRDLLMFSALPDAPVLPPGRARRSRLTGAARRALRTRHGPSR